MSVFNVKTIAAAAAILAAARTATPAEIRAGYNETGGAALGFIAEKLGYFKWEKRDARVRLSEHEEGNYGATLCGRCMIFRKAGEAALLRRREAAKARDGYDGDTETHGESLNQKRAVL
jgi:hypothetical protein